MLFTVREAGREIGVCERTAWTYIKQRRLRTTRLSTGLTRVSQAAINDFLRDCESESEPLCFSELAPLSEDVHAA